MKNSQLSNMLLKVGCFFLLKSLYYQRLFVSLQHENPPSLSTMLKCAGRFLRPLPPRFKHVLLNCGSIFAVIYC